MISLLHVLFTHSRLIAHDDVNDGVRLHYITPAIIAQSISQLKKGNDDGNYVLDHQIISLMWGVVCMYFYLYYLIVCLDLDITQNIYSFLPLCLYQKNVS